MVVHVSGGHSTRQPPDWAIEPCPGVYYLDAVRDGEVIDRINLDNMSHVFRRLWFLLVTSFRTIILSCQHAAVIPHRNGRPQFELFTSREEDNVDVASGCGIVASTRHFSYC